MVNVDLRFLRTTQQQTQFPYHICRIADKQKPLFFFLLILCLRPETPRPTLFTILFFIFF